MSGIEINFLVIFRIEPLKQRIIKLLKTVDIDNDVFSGYENFSKKLAKHFYSVTLTSDWISKSKYYYLLYDKLQHSKRNNYIFKLSYKSIRSFLKYNTDYELFKKMYDNYTSVFYDASRQRIHSKKPKTLLDMVAYNGTYEIIEFLNSIPYHFPISTQSKTIAIERGNLLLAKFYDRIYKLSKSLENYRVPIETIKKIIKKKDKITFDYIITNHLKSFENYPEQLITISFNNDIEIFKILLENRYLCQQEPTIKPLQSLLRLSPSDSNNEITELLISKYYYSFNSSKIEFIQDCKEILYLNKKFDIYNRYFPNLNNNNNNILIEIDSKRSNKLSVDIILQSLVYKNDIRHFKKLMDDGIIEFGQLNETILNEILPNASLEMVKFIIGLYNDNETLFRWNIKTPFKKSKGRLLGYEIKVLEYLLQESNIDVYNLSNAYWYDNICFPSTALCEGHEELAKMYFEYKGSGSYYDKFLRLCFSRKNYEMIKFLADTENAPWKSSYSRLYWITPINIYQIEILEWLVSEFSGKITKSELANTYTNLFTAKNCCFSIKIVVPVNHIKFDPTGNNSPQKVFQFAIDNDLIESLDLLEFLLYFYSINDLESVSKIASFKLIPWEKSFKYLRSLDHFLVNKINKTSGVDVAEHFSLTTGGRKKYHQDWDDVHLGGKLSIKQLKFISKFIKITQEDMDKVLIPYFTTRGFLKFYYEYWNPNSTNKVNPIMFLEPQFNYYTPKKQNFRYLVNHPLMKKPIDADLLSSIRFGLKIDFSVIRDYDDVVLVTNLIPAIVNYYKFEAFKYYFRRHHSNYNQFLEDVFVKKMYPDLLHDRLIEYQFQLELINVGYLEPRLLYVLFPYIKIITTNNLFQIYYEAFRDKILPFAKVLLNTIPVDVKLKRKDKSQIIFQNFKRESQIQLLQVLYDISGLSLTLTDPSNVLYLDEYYLVINHNTKTINIFSITFQALYSLTVEWDNDSKISSFLKDYFDYSIEKYAFNFNMSNDLSGLKIPIGDPQLNLLCIPDSLIQTLRLEYIDLIIQRIFTYKKKKVFK